MTLILTELSPLGIAMAADTAIMEDVLAPDRSLVRRAYYGRMKLFPIPKLQSGVSHWGNDIGGVDATMDTEFWIRNFINTAEYETVEEFAHQLQNELRRVVPELTVPIGSDEYRYGNMGFHLAGYVDYEGNRVPTFWHIHNGQSEVFPNINPR